jgi:hypothetical protein
VHSVAAVQEPAAPRPELAVRDPVSEFAYPSEWEEEEEEEGDVGDEALSAAPEEAEAVDATAAAARESEKMQSQSPSPSQSQSQSQTPAPAHGERAQQQAQQELCEESDSTQQEPKQQQPGSASGSKSELELEPQPQQPEQQPVVQSTCEPELERPAEEAAHLEPELELAPKSTTTSLPLDSDVESITAAEALAEVSAAATDEAAAVSAPAPVVDEWKGGEYAQTTEAEERVATLESMMEVGSSL